jgi:DNA polymerase III alpha subunit (gram-positive type)
MNDKLSQSQKLLHDSLFELYMQGGLELYHAGTRGLKRDLIIDLETSALTPEHGKIIHFYAINRWDEDDEFDDWARPSFPLSDEAERVVGVTNEKLAGCRPTMAVMDDFLRFVHRLT